MFSVEEHNLKGTGCRKLAGEEYSSARLHESRKSIIVNTAFLTCIIATLTTFPPLAGNYYASGQQSGDLSHMIIFSRWHDGIPEIFVMNDDGTGQRGLGIHGLSPTWSPDGNKIAFFDSGNIYTMNSDGTGLKQLTSLGFDFWPTWSPDGKKLAFIRHDGVTDNLTIINADGTGVVNIKSSTGYLVEPAWSPDGAKIAYADVSKGNDIFTINTDGTGEHNLTNDPGAADTSPSWSPDGNRIAFTKNYNVYTMFSNGTQIAALTDVSPNFALLPSWSPDGTKISFDLRTPNDQIYVMNADGSHLENLSNNGFDDLYPDFNPVATELQYVININSVDTRDAPVTGLWVTIRDMNNKLLASGYTPLTFAGEPLKEYKVSVANYDGKIFQHWQDSGSTSKTRIINLSSDTDLTAIYDIGASIGGFTPLTFTNHPYYSQGDLVINARTTGQNNNTLHMWMTVAVQESKYETTYKVYATNGYQNLVFDHWEDGSTDRIRAITVGQATTITAYYKTG